MKWLSILCRRISDRIVKAKGLSTAISISVLNQMISSGANFAFGLYLVRVLTPSEFGLYGIGFAAVLFYAGVCNALFLTQMVVHVPSKVQVDRVPYAARTLVTMVFFCLITIFLTALPLIFFNGYGSTSIQEYTDLAISTIVAAVAYVLKEYFVRHAYTAKNEIGAVAVNFGVATMLFTTLLTNHYLFSVMNAVSALLIYAGSNLTGAFIGLLFFRLPVLAVRVHDLLYDVKESWVGGRWALGGVSVTWLQTQAYVYVTAFFIGPAGVGFANAVKILITPAQFIMPAITQLLMPRLAEIGTNDIGRMLEIRKKFTTLIIIFALIYSAVLLTFLDKLGPIILGEHYKDIVPLAVAWCLVLIFQFSLVGSSIVMQVMKNFKMLTLLNIFSFVVALSASVLLMQKIGTQGAILGSAIGDLILSFLLYRAIMKDRNAKC